MNKVEVPTAALFVPKRPSLASLQEASKACRGCYLFERATQTVFGEGPRGAPFMFVGEQPGDQEDRQGRPFVGPAGRLLDKALADAEIERRMVYVTNAVKHFKFEVRGKRRIHQKPNALEIAACHPWLEAEIGLIQPEVVVCLGASAAQALLGRSFRVTKDRGILFPHRQAKRVAATVHPSSLLRMPDRSKREVEYSRFVDDLRRIREGAASV